MKRFPYLVLAFAMSGLISQALFGAATRVGFKDAAATARGNAFAATADSPAAIYYNPAGLTQLEGQSVSTTVYVVQLDASYRNASGTQSAKMERKTNYVPQVFYAWAPRDEPYAFGIGVYAPFGLSTKWESSSPLNTFALNAEQKTYSIAMVGALDLGGGFSIGGGPVLQRAETTLARGVGLSSGDYFAFDAEGNTLGFSAGLRWAASEKHAFGLSYQHHYSVHLKGTAETSPYIPGKESARADQTFPEVIILGYSFRPAPGWNFEVNLDWTNWERVNSLTISKPSGNVVLPFNWQPGFFYDFGVTKEIGGGFSVSAGYTFAENSVPDDTYIPGVPDADRHIFAIGTGYKSRHTSFQLTCQYGHSPDRTVRGSPPNLLGATADGTYTNSLYAIAASFDYRF